MTQQNDRPSKEPTVHLAQHLSDLGWRRSMMVETNSAAGADGGEARPR